MPRNRRINAQLSEELRCYVRRIRLHLAIDLEGDDLGLFDDALEELGRRASRERCEVCGGVWGCGVSCWCREREDG